MLLDFDKELKELRKQYILKGKKIKNLSSYLAWSYLNKKPAKKLLKLIQKDPVIKSLFYYQKNSLIYNNLFSKIEKFLIELLNRSYSNKTTLDLKTLICFSLIYFSDNNRITLIELFKIQESKLKRIVKFYNSYILNSCYFNYI